MIKSIRYFLLISLLLSITIASAVNGIGNYLLDEQVIQPYLDDQLTRLSTLIDILHHSTKLNKVIRNELNTYLLRSQLVDKSLIEFQIWDNNGELVMHSPNTNIPTLKNIPEGFSDQIIHGNTWRMYSKINDATGSKIVVAELYTVRRELTDAIARINANILLITYPVFGLLVWFIVSLALHSITRVTNEISSRASTFLEPVQLTEIPIEIKPLVAELNQLFIRLKLAFDRNKRFAADAAHELRTPLAALKTHLQISVMAKTEEERKKALEKVLESVDRSSHVVAQLLTLSRLGEEEEYSDMKPIDLHKVATETIAYIAPHALEKQIDIELTSPPRPSGIIVGNEVALGILIRNIVDNAIRYTPPHGEVKVSILNTGSEVILRVIDSGQGIPPELRERVFERFYRILGTKASGSGLGLAIVSQIAKLHQATLKLDTPKSGSGLQFDVIFPRSQ